MMRNLKGSLIVGHRIQQGRYLLSLRQISNNADGGENKGKGGSAESTKKLEDVLNLFQKVNPAKLTNGKKNVSKVSRFSPIKSGANKKRPPPNSTGVKTVEFSPIKWSSEVDKAEPVPSTANVDEEISKAARDVAAALPGDPGVTANELLSALTRPAPATTAKHDFKSLLSSMSVIREKAQTSMNERYGPVKETSQRLDNPPTHNAPKRPKTHRSYGIEHVDIHAGSPLNIFTVTSQEEQPSVEKDKNEQEALAEAAESPAAVTWSSLMRRELSLLSTVPPRSAWEEMARWTDKGMMWPLPVDNELGKLEDASVGFEEHIFLERYIESWCPKSGPIRKFMSLVCSSLSNNFRFSAQQKREHLEWFREYFDKKESLLKELDCL